MTHMRTMSNIELADNEVDIFLALNLAGAKVAPSYDSESVKIHCPFCLAYDPGRIKEKSLRVYFRTNTAFCYREHEFFTPTRIASKAWDKSPASAAIALLERIGYLPPSVGDVWANVQPKPLPPDRSVLGKTLRMYCERIDPQWSTRQFEPKTAEVLGSCLSLLSVVNTEQDVEDWLRDTKRVMQNMIA